MNRSIPVFFILSTIGLCPLALGQGYTYTYGNSRVNVESLNGRSNPSSTYIGPGTVSKSAQGIIKYGAQVNPGLPKVNRGAYIGTPGDNLYTMNPILSQEPKQLMVQRNRKITYTQQAKKAPDIFVPDPNVPLNYANFPTESSTRSTKNTDNAAGYALHEHSKQSSYP